MRKILLFLMLLFTGNLFAQNYTRDAGIRLGDYFSATYRQYMDDDQAIEGLLLLGRHGMTITVMKEYFQPAMSHLSDHLYFQYGFGAHVGFRYIDRYRVLNRVYLLEKHRFSPLIGVDGLAGIEYRFPEFPFLIGFDIKPYFEYSTTQIFSIYLQSIGISLKYKF
jgi:hypothetical protein